VLIGATFYGGGSIWSAEPPAVEKKPDWAALDALVTAGDYREAARVADEIAVTVKPKRRAPDFLPRSIEFIRAQHDIPVELITDIQLIHPFIDLDLKAENQFPTNESEKK
jgi:hypothetical protein